MVSDTPKYHIKPVYTCTTMHTELSCYLPKHLSAFQKLNTPILCRTHFKPGCSCKKYVPDLAK